jgi:hypothetical protein
VDIAALWHLPVIFFCANHHHTEFAPGETQDPAPLQARAADHGIGFRQVYGKDVVAANGLMSGPAAWVRQGQDPFIVESERSFAGAAITTVVSTLRDSRERGLERDAAGAGNLRGHERDQAADVGPDKGDPPHGDLRGCKSRSMRAPTPTDPLTPVT